MLHILAVAIIAPAHLPTPSLSVSPEAQQQYPTCFVSYMQTEDEWETG